MPTTRRPTAAGGSTRSPTPSSSTCSRTANDANAVILFGGTWCPNTRPVIGADQRVRAGERRPGLQLRHRPRRWPGRRHHDQRGQPAAGAQHRQQRHDDGERQPHLPLRRPREPVPHEHQHGVQAGDEPASPTTRAATPPAPLTSTKKLQVPFVLGYRGKAGDQPNGGVTRQWIIDNGNDTYTEYMSQWWFTNPQPNQLGITQIPLDRSHLVDDQRPAGELHLADGPGHGVREHGHRHRRRPVPRRHRQGERDATTPPPGP